MRKRNKISIPILMIFFMVFTITPSFFVFQSTIQTTTTFDIVDIQELEPKTSQFISRAIRVAIYNEPNTTRPSYASVGYLTNSYADLKTLLEGEGYQVDELTLADIQDHKLMTADYDVFIMVNNLPKEGIVNLVKEFWLGGGGIMSFDSAISYICYAGMIPPESEGLENYGVYWNYLPYATTSNIAVRHPVTKEYQVDDVITESNFDWAAFDWTALMSSAYASDFVKLATKLGYPNDATVVGNDPSTKGGRVIQMFGDGDDGGSIGGDRGDIIIDAVEWLCPRPKGRIAYDLSHRPVLGIDNWDYLSPYPGYYSQWRNSMTSRDYTFDKLYPSTTGNFTANRLEDYDVLVIMCPEYNISSSDRTAVENWVASGGSLFIIAENPFAYGANFYLTNEHINFLLNDFNLKMNQSVDISTAYPNPNLHPTTEGCSQLYLLACGAINISGDAFSIWESGPHNVVAGQEYGKGRVIMVSDINWLTNTYIASVENHQYGINVVNWLTAAQAKVLLFTDFPLEANFYVTPVALALNELRIPFALIFDDAYLNLSLYKYAWELVIVDQTNYPMDYSILIDYVDSGGRLIMSGYEVDDYSTNPLWAKLGFSYAENAPDDVPIYLWNSSHSIFTNPAPYGANNFTPFVFPIDDGDVLTVYSNATALAGFTPTIETGKASIVLRNDKKTLFNGHMIDMYSGDVDDSTYEDRYELWLNEIAFMAYESLSVSIDYPYSGDAFSTTAPDFTITTGGVIIEEMYYTLDGGSPHSISSTSGTIDQGAWDALPDGYITLRFYVEDTVGSSKYEELIIIKDTQAPIIEIISPTSGKKFSSSAPDFIVEITDEHLDKMWYTLDSGLTEYFFTANGTINEAAWDALSVGTVIIHFYASDIAGNISSAQVSITKEKKKGIPGFNLFIIIGVISVISILILEKKFKTI